MFLSFVKTMDSFDPNAMDVNELEYLIRNMGVMILKQRTLVKKLTLDLQDAEEGLQSLLTERQYYQDKMRTAKRRRLF